MVNHGGGEEILLVNLNRAQIRRERTGIEFDVEFGGELVEEEVGDEVKQAHIAPIEGRACRASPFNNFADG